MAWYGKELWQDVNLRHWLFYDESYSDLVGHEWWAGAVRLAVMAIAVVLCAAFFALVPRGGHWWTHFGQYTMYVYMLHSFVLYPFRESGLLRDLEPTWIWLPIVIVASVLIAVGLSTKPVRRAVPAARGTAAQVALQRSLSRRARGPAVRPHRVEAPARRFLSRRQRRRRAAAPDVDGSARRRRDRVRSRGERTRDDGRRPAR